MPYFDRLDIVSAYYQYFCDYHSGQWSTEYRRLSKILKYFSPGIKLQLSENAIEIYNILSNKHGV